MSSSLRQVMRTGIFTLVIIIVFVWRGQAQEFWLQPNKIQYKVGDTLKISFLKGVNFDGRRIAMPKEKVERLELHQVKSIENLKPGMIEGAKFSASLPLQSEGTKMIVSQTAGDVIHYTAQEFNAFLKDNGLDEVIARRNTTNTADNPATEIFACYEKLLIQVGNIKDDTFKENANLPLEIIPDKNPLALKKGDVIHFKVLFQGKPEFGARVRIWNYYDYLTTTQNIFTQKDGTIEMTISSVGSWLINVVKIVPEKGGASEWQTYRSSLMFGLK